MSQSTTPIASTKVSRLVRWGIGLALVAGLVGVGAWAATSVRWTTPTVERAEIYLAKKEYRAAADEAGAYLRSKPNDPRALFDLARARGGLDDWAGSVRALEQIPDWSLRKAEALLVAGNAYKTLKRGRDAERAFRECIARDREGGMLAHGARLQLLKLLAMEERVEEFKDVAWQLYDRVPDAERLNVLTLMTQIEFEQSKPEINIASLRPMVAADPADPYARAGLGAALDRSGDLAAARAEYARALEAAPGDFSLRERYLDLLHRIGDMDAVATVLRSSPTGGEDRAELRKFAGIVAEAAGDFPAAEAAYRRAAELDPTEPEYRHRLSQALYRLGRKEEADAQAAERARLNGALDDLRRAWNAFATPFETDPARIDPALVRGMARALDAAGWQRESAAWEREADRRAAEAR